MCSMCVHICKYIRIAVFPFTYIYVALCVSVYVCVQLREKRPHLSIGNTYEDTCNKLDTSCYSRELEAALMLKITRMEK